MRKISDFEKIIISFGVIVVAFFLASIMKCVSYSVVLSTPDLWSTLYIYRRVGVEAAYVYAHCYDNFVYTLIFRLTGWCVCAIISGSLLVFRFIVPFCKYLKRKSSRGNK